jgi:hypothetical protein
MLVHERDLDESRIKVLKKLALQVVPLLPDDQNEAEYVLGLAWVHVAFLNEHKTPSEIAEETVMDKTVLEFRRTGSSRP